MVYFVKVLGQVEKVVSPFNFWFVGHQTQVIRLDSRHLCRLSRLPGLRFAY